MTVSAQTYDDDKRFLWGLCYRMTGSAADAEDIVQDTFVKALEKPPSDLEAPLRPWLVKVALNLSRDQLRRRRRREYFGPWLPSPVLTESEDLQTLDEPTPPEMSPVARYDLHESVTLAFLLALEALTPVQRAVLLLRDVFDYSTSETATTMQMTEINVKVTLHRARRIMRAYDKDHVKATSMGHEEMRRTLEHFLAEPMYGRAKVLRLIAKLYEAYRTVTSTSLHLLNGEPAVVVERSKVQPGHASFYTMHCELDVTSRVRRLHFVFAPSKLSALKQKSRPNSDVD